MGCKCGRDILFRENEIIKAESIKKSHHKNEPLNMNNSIPLESNLNSNDDNYDYNVKKPEISLIHNNDESNIIFTNLYGTQRSSLENPINNEISQKNEYPQKSIYLINEIRSNPLLYSQVVEKAIENIKITNNNRIIYSNGIKVALYRGEEAFREAINKLKNTESLPPLRFNPQLCIPLPENEMELNNINFLKEQVDKMRQRNTHVEIYFKDLIKIPEISILLIVKITVKKEIHY